MCPDPNHTDRINSYALVSYIPEPLSGFLNRLRQELVPNCFLRAHVTILPPRPSTVPSDVAWENLRSVAERFQPFDVELNTVEVFPVSDVIYVSVSEGDRELRNMHEAMNINGLAFNEAYPYHPHITLAQGLKPDELDELVRVAKTRWDQYGVPRKFRVDTISFVQSTRRKTWIDLAERKLESPFERSLLGSRTRMALHLRR
jgi:2'-5' RNA ligase